MDSLLIFGGGGFVGKHVARDLRASFSVTVCDRSIDRDYFGRYPEINCRQLSLPDPQGLAEIVDETRPYFAINLISLVNASRDLSLFGDLIRSNLDVLLELYDGLARCRSLKLLLQFGSAEEYGAIATPFREDSREEPSSPYAIVKQATSNMALMLFRCYGFPAAVIRPGNLFGTFQPTDKLIPYIFRKLMTHESIELTPGEQKRDFIYAPDLAEPLSGLLREHERSRGQIVNVSYGEGVTIRAVVEHLSKRLGSRSSIRFGALPYRNGEMMDFSCDVHKVRELTGWVPRRNVFDALDDYCKKQLEQAS